MGVCRHRRRVILARPVPLTPGARRGPSAGGAAAIRAIHAQARAHGCCTRSGQADIAILDVLHPHFGRCACGAGRRVGP